MTRFFLDETSREDKGIHDVACIKETVCELQLISLPAPTSITTERYCPVFIYPGVCLRLSLWRPNGYYAPALCKSALYANSSYSLTWYPQIIIVFKNIWINPNKWAFRGRNMNENQCKNEECSKICLKYPQDA